MSQYKIVLRQKGKADGQHAGRVRGAQVGTELGCWARRLLGAQGAGRARALGERAQGEGRAGRHDRQQGAHGAQAGVRGRAGGRRVGGRRAGAAGARKARALGAGRAAWAHGLSRAVHSVHSAWFSTRFFVSVFFLSH